MSDLSQGAEEPESIQSLANSFSFRRELIFKKTPVTEIITMYPALFAETSEISSEMKRIAGVDAVENLTKWLQENSKLIKEFIEKKKTLHKETMQLKDLLFTFRSNSLLPEEEKDLISGIILLPAVFLEKHASFIEILEVGFKLLYG